MDLRANPYTPGAGLRPAALAGRDTDVEAFEILADRVAGGPASRSLVFSGLRGIGKTALAGELANGVRRRAGWMTRATEAVGRAFGSIASFQATVGADGVNLGVERLFDYRAVDRLCDADALFALAEPAAAREITWGEEAARAVLDASGGYPYFLQQFGKTTWDVAAGPDVVTAEDAGVGVAEGQRQLDVGFYASRWERATRSERELLRAMAPDRGAPSRTADIVARLGRSGSQAIGPARAKLIAKGIVYSPEHGALAYTVPGMASYVERREDA